MFGLIAIKHVSAECVVVVAVSLPTVSKGKQGWRAGETALMTDFISNNDFYDAHDCVVEEYELDWSTKVFVFFIDLTAEEAVHLTHSLQLAHCSFISVVEVHSFIHQGI